MAEKNADFIPYKFKELKVYGNTEWLADSKKKYRSVLERAELTYLYAEFSLYNKYFDEQDWQAKINLKCQRLNASFAIEKEVCNIELNQTISQNDNIVFFREGWGNDTKGKFWEKGIYKWEAYVNDTLTGSTFFYVEDKGSISPEDNPYFNIAGVKLYEGPFNNVSQGSRTYYTQFHGAETRYIWVELEIQNKVKDVDTYIEVVFNFYNDARQLKGRTNEVVLMRSGQEQIFITSGWGSDTKGTWHVDANTLEIISGETLLAVIPFNVADSFVEGVPAPVATPSAVAGVVAGPKHADPETMEEAIARLDRLIGLEVVKNHIRENITYLNYLKIRKEKGIEDGEKISLHSVFRGNPGTGKTTVAKMLGNIYKQMGLLSKGHVHEVDRSDIVGEYIGQTAPKVKEAINKARGGILFIDEAYSLARAGEDSKDFGKEVIEILLKELSDGKGDLAIIVAGYPKEMNAFLDSNPGLKSRFSQYFDFEDYLPQELIRIAEFVATDKKVTVTDEAKKYLYEVLVEAYRNRDRTFGNARYVNSILSEAKVNLGLRVMKHPNPAELTEAELSTIELADLKQIFAAREGRRPDIPIDQHLLEEALADLNHLIGMNAVKMEVNELVKLMKFYREIGKDMLNSISLHTVFTGNPGTGKTTVARILARIFKALGLLEKGHLVECDRESLVAGYVGQTAMKTAAKIDEAMGGVLFIDEAYALTDKGGDYQFGKEAVETILKRMEDQRGKFIVIAAGYPDNMKVFIEANPGLKSRFDKFIHFPDYTGEELMVIADMMYKENKVHMDSFARKHLELYLNHLVAHRDKFFGNARSVRRIIEESVRNQHLRLAALPVEQRTSEALEMITLSDVEEFNINLEELSNTNRGKIGFGQTPGNKPG